MNWTYEHPFIMIRNKTMVSGLLMNRHEQYENGTFRRHVCRRHVYRLRWPSYNTTLFSTPCFLFRFSYYGIFPFWEISRNTKIEEGAPGSPTENARPDTGDGQEVKPHLNSPHTCRQGQTPTRLTRCRRGWVTQLLWTRMHQAAFTIQQQEKSTRFIQKIIYTGRILNNIYRSSCDRRGLIHMACPPC